MKCTDYNKKYQEIEQLEYEELAAAVRAHGDEYVFFDCGKDDAEDEWVDRDNYDDLPHISGGNKWNSISTDFYVTRVKLNEHGRPTVYGFSQEFGGPSDEDMITYIEYSYVGCITELIPETDEIKDVTYRVF